MSEHVQSLWSSYQPLAAADAELIARVAPPGKPGAAKISNQHAAKHDALLRRHFLDLTGAFLTPFAR